MAKRIPAEHTRVMPYLHYRDPEAALAFLERAFGFHTRFAHREGGVVRHAQVAVGPHTFMLGPAQPAFRSAAADECPGLHASVWCYVDDVDAHHARARAAGATILRPPSDQPYGVREYDALDGEGQEWYFTQVLDARKMVTAGTPKRRRPHRPVAKKKPRKKAAPRKAPSRKARRRPH
jgi:uncharacterized glyoxalase superfamily protein PhnB